MQVPATLARFRRWLLPLVAVAIVGVVLYILDHELRHFRYHEIAARVRDIPPARLALSLLLTGLVYLVLPLYDFTALAYVHQRVPYRRIAFASSIAYAISQTLGFPALTGGGIRYRFWSSWGINAGDIARGVSFVAVTFVVGVAAVNALVLLMAPTEGATILHLAPWLAQAIGGALLAGVLAYQAAAWRMGGRVVTALGFEMPVPRRGIAALQFAIPIADWSLAAAVLYALFPPGQAPDFPAFVAAFVLAQFAGIVSHVPGGAGVFETVMLVLLRPVFPADQIVATLLAYRVVYYGIPFVLGAATLAVHELWRRRAGLRTAAAFTGRWGTAIAPPVLAAGTFLAGMVLLFSGAAPSIHSRVTLLARLLPIGVIEVSHFTGSLLGLVLLVLAWALWHRLDTAWALAIAALAMGAVASLLKGLDWEEATVMLAVLLVLLPTRGEFYRKSALLHEPLEPGWVAAIIGVVGASIWLGSFAYKHVEYQGELWWQFTAHGDASRFLRASAGAVTGIALLGVMRLLRHSVAEPGLPTSADLDVAARIAAAAPETMPNLALLGDKCLLFNAARDAMLMYGVERRSWIALGDPVGPDAACAELTWRFREAADAHGAWPAFYQVTARHLPLYIDLGLTFIKLGEEAIVPLAEFSLEGGGRKGLRRTHREMTREGVTFGVVPREQVAGLMPELRRISDDWLAAKTTREKGFSLGRFDPGYLERFPAAVVRKDGRPVAFANVWTGAPGTEVSIDLMRYATDAPRGVMEYLFIELMLWGRTNGFAECTLGMAPLAGLADRALAPLWNRAGAWLFRHGEHFYNFQGLRQYKEKFDPVWRPRYLASPGGLALPRIVANVATLISGGVKGLVAR